VVTEGSGSGSVVVSINDLMFAQDRIEAAAVVYGLSPSQQSIAEQIIAGQDLVRAASNLGVSVTTARTQLQRMFEKTGVRSQPALVRALLSVVSPASDLPV
jgi:DNA-binding CsgD family transcriptional regulator